MKSTEVAATFDNPDTRERWEWVAQAITVAENDSMKALETRADIEVPAAESPFE
ncbi:MAG: hypothetical protein AB8F65_04840 [Woeseiaceae bacterium]